MLSLAIKRIGMRILWIFLIACLAWAVVSDKIFMATLPLRSHIRRWLRKVKKP